MKTTLSWTRPDCGRRVLLGLAIVILALGLIPGSTHAAERERQAYTWASADSTDCVEEQARQLCTATFLNYYSGRDGPEVCLSISQYAISPSDEYTYISSEFGCTRAGVVFTIDTKRLSSATLAPTTVTLETHECTPQGCEVISSRDVMVAATFTGTGNLETFKNRSTRDERSCRYTYGGKGIGRNASTSLTLDGQALEGSGYLSTSMNLTKVQCR